MKMEDIKVINLDHLEKSDLILVIANMHDVIQKWDDGYGLSDRDSAILNGIGNECRKIISNYDLSPIVENCFIVGDYVVFSPEKAMKMNLTTPVWNQSYILKVEELRDDTLRFSFTQMVDSGCEYLKDKNQGGYYAGNSYKCFRRATSDEIKKAQNR